MDLYPFTDIVKGHSETIGISKNIGNFDTSVTHQTHQWWMRTLVHIPIRNDSYTTTTTVIATTNNNDVIIINNNNVLLVIL